MTILALEFSSAQRSVAVLREEDSGSVAHHCAERPPAALPLFREQLTLSEVIETNRGNAMRPLAMVEEALRQAGVERDQIECLAVGRGPGSYTGIRAAIALAQGWQLARGVKLLGVSSAEAIAAEAENAGLRGRVHVVLDAQRNEFYLAAWEIGPTGRREVEPLRLTGREEIDRRAQAGETLIGPDITRWVASGRGVFPRAAIVGQLALGRTDFTPGEKLEPIYLRETQFVKAPPPRLI